MELLLKAIVGILEALGLSLLLISLAGLLGKIAGRFSKYRRFE